MHHAKHMGTAKHEPLPPKADVVPDPAEPAIPAEPAEPVVPQALPDDPDIGDGSMGREGVAVSSWRLHQLKEDELLDVTDQGGFDRQSRKARRAHVASRKARSNRRRVTRGRVRVFVAVLFVLVAGGLVAAGVTYSLEMWGGKTVPNVLGAAEGKAQESLAQKGFVVETAEVLADTGEGHVVTIDPEAGARLPEGTTVHLTIAKSRVIPEVVDLSKDEAVQALQEVGASNIRYEWRDVFEDKDVVLEVRPEAGSVFLSSDEVVLVVSQRPTVPDVVGMTEADAREALKNQDYPVEFVYEQGESDQRHKVMRTDPDAGEAVHDEGMTVVVGDPLRDVLTLADYLDTKASRIDEFLGEQGFSKRAASSSEDGHVAVRYQNDAKDKLSFVSDPWSNKIDDASGTGADVMGDGTSIEGVRLSATFAKPSSKRTDGTKTSQGQNQNGENATGANGTTGSTDTTTGSTTATTEATAALEGADSVLELSNPSVGKTTANEVMEKCGFSGTKDFCTQADIELPKGTPNTGHEFYCCYGEMDSYVWTVLVRATTTSAGAKATQVVATCAPKSAYAVIDLSKFGDNICDFVAYWGEYA